MKKLLCCLLVLVLALSTCAFALAEEADTVVRESTKAKGIKTEEDTIEVAILLSASNHQTFIDMIRHARTLEEPLNCEIIEYYYEQDINALVSGIENFTADGVDVIIFQNNDPEATRDAVQRANDAGIITCAWDIDMDICDFAYYGVGYDIGYAIGKMAADYINENLGGEAKIGVFKFDTASWAKERGEGLQAALDELLPNAEIVGEVYGIDTDGGYTDTENLLTLDPDMNVMVALFDNPLIGAYNAFQAAGKASSEDTQIYLFGCDCTKEGMQIMLGDNPYVYFSSIFMDLNTLTKTMVTNCVNARRGIMPESRCGYFGLDPVNRDNADEYPQIFE